MVQFSIGGKLLVVETAFSYHDRRPQPIVRCEDNDSRHQYIQQQIQYQQARWYGPSHSVLGGCLHLLSSMRYYVNSWRYRGPSNTGRFIVLTNNAYDAYAPSTSFSSPTAEYNYHKKGRSEMATFPGFTGFSVRSSEDNNTDLDYNKSSGPQEREEFPARQSHETAVQESMEPDKMEQSKKFQELQLPGIGAGDNGETLTKPKEDGEDNYCSS